MVQEILNQILQAQVAEHLGAGHYQRTETRQGYRNGYRLRMLKTRVGKLTLQVPKVRDGHFSTDLFARYQRSEQALLATLMEMVVDGVPTRKICNITKELCGTEFSKSTVSELIKGLDPVVHEWNERSPGGDYSPFPMVDGMVIKIRKNGHLRNHSILIGIGVNSTGVREILGFRTADS